MRTTNAVILSFAWSGFKQTSTKLTEILGWPEVPLSLSQLAEHPHIHSWARAVTSTDQLDGSQVEDATGATEMPRKCPSVLNEKFLLAL